MPLKNNKKIQKNLDRKQRKSLYFESLEKYIACGQKQDEINIAQDLSNT